VGKPVVVQNVKVRESFGDRALFHRIFFIDDEIWFCDVHHSILLKMNKETWEPEYMGNFTSSSGWFLYLYLSGVLHNENLYFAPYRATEIAEYNIQKKMMTYIPYGNIKCDDGFTAVLNYEKYIFFTPYMYNAIMRFDTESKEIDFFADWLEPLKQLTTEEKLPFFAMPLRITENTIMLPAYGANAVVEFNMETLKSKVYEVGQKGYRYNGICFDGKDYWLSPLYNGPIVKWNPDVGIIKEFTNVVEGCLQNEISFRSIVFCEGYVWLFPELSKQTLKINIETNEVFKVEEFKPNFIEDESRIVHAAYNFVQNIGNIIYTYDGRDGTFIEYDCKTQKKREKILKYSPLVLEKIKPLWQKYILYNNDMAKWQKITDCYYYERYWFTIFDYINCEMSNYNSTKKQLFSAANSNADGKAGKEIFNAVKAAVL